MATPVFNTLSLHDALPICHGIANALDLRGVPAQGDVQPEGLLPEPEHLVARLRHAELAEYGPDALRLIALGGCSQVYVDGSVPVVDPDHVDAVGHFMAVEEVAVIGQAAR